MKFCFYFNKRRKKKAIGIAEAFCLFFRSSLQAEGWIQFSEIFRDQGGRGNDRGRK